jgi:hypothetical protein
MVPIPFVNIIILKKNSFHGHVDAQAKGVK